MYRVPLLVLAYAFAAVDTTITTCTTDKYDKGLGNGLVCSNVTLNDISGDGSIVSDITIFQSRIENVPDRSFLRYGKSLISLNMHDCGIREISANAFDGLTYLRKLSLSYNNITWVREQWFASLISLEQLDLSYNLIASIEPTVLEKLRGLRRLDVRGNRLTCLQPNQLASMAGLEKLCFSSNPLTFRCRGTLTLWLRDMGISYATEQRAEESWLDRLLWLCAAEDGKVADSEVFMKECVILNLFNQLRTGLTTAESYPLAVSQQCTAARDELTKCVATDRRFRREVITNGHVVRKLLRQLKESKSAV